MKQIKDKKLIPVLVVCLIMVITACMYINMKKQEDNRTVVTIAVMQDDNVQNFNTNYYTKWLEEQTGYNIQFEYIPEGYEKEYLYAMLKADRGRIDAVFLPEKEKLLTFEDFAGYTEENLIYDMSEYITVGCHLAELMEQYESISMREKLCENGSFYYMPNMDTTRRNKNMQIMWINMGWLKRLGLKVPQTVEELKTVLETFRDNDPNGNGLTDELPLISCEASYSLQSYNFIINAYIYNDPLHMRYLADENGNLTSAVAEPAFRRGLNVCTDMYAQGLLTDECSNYSERQLMELVNSPSDCVGAFTSQSIADIIYSNCPDILARFIQVSPLIGTNGEQHAVYLSTEPGIGGYIPANSSHTKEAFEIMDLMLSKEAAFIASFGEENTDWRFSESGDLSTYGSRAIITTLQYLKETVQNKHFAGTGPLVLASEYSDGVTWNGNNSLVEYIDARAVRSYENFYYEAREIFKSDEWFDYMNKAGDTADKADVIIRQFIFGERDITSDAEWEEFQNEVNQDE